MHEFTASKKVRLGSERHLANHPVAPFSFLASILGRGLLNNIKSRVVILFLTGVLWSIFCCATLWAAEGNPIDEIREFEKSRENADADPGFVPALEGARVFLGTDDRHDFPSDLKTMQKFQARLKKLGIEAEIGDPPERYCRGANEHYHLMEDCPEGSWVVFGVSGLCAGTFWDVAQSYAFPHFQKKNGIKGFIYLNLRTSDKLCRDLDFLKLSDDDNFCSSTGELADGGLHHPYQYLVDHGFFMAESLEYVSDEAVVSDERVAVLSDIIADIIFKNGKETSSRKGSSEMKRVRYSDAEDPAVKELQQLLKSLGFFRDCKIDGWYGPHTALAVMEYECSKSLPPTGIATPELIARMKSGD